ncbi:MAG: amino acid ABC transporter ATP-binding protein [Alphaproteobacteria bacterium]|nr:amino acid ABC transporter ATP-binding protein [Alphaproteobacteria bacterium]
MIEIKNLSKTFGTKKILNNLTYKFAANKSTLILGPSGSGKTTLIRCIIGLEKQDKGEILFDNNQITPQTQESFNRKIGMVFQSCELFPHMTAIENVLYAPRVLRISDLTIAREKAEKLFEEFGIATKQESRPFNLSGGQRQKVAIIRTLMIDPKVVIFDEPTSALDPESIQDLVNIIEGINHKLTVIIVSHHLSFAKKLADHIVFMDQGHILCSQDSDDFFKSPNSVRAKLFLDAVSDYL